MRIFITGGTGCLGANIADRYLDRGAEVLALDNFATSSPNALEPRPGLRVVEGDVADLAMVNRLFDEFEPTHVVHSAASYKDPNDWTRDIATNVTGTAHVVRASERHNVSRFIYLQTALSYGRAIERPVTLKHPLAPFTSYGISKTAGEQYVAMSKLPWVSLRLANIYGPRHYSGPIPTFYKRLRSGQACIITDARRDFLEMEDFLRLVDLVFEKRQVIGPFNVSSGRDVTIKDLFDRIVLNLGIELSQPATVLPPSTDDVGSLLLDPSETTKAFGWLATIGLDEGLKRQIMWFDAHGVGETYTHLKIGNQ